MMTIKKEKNILIRMIILIVITVIIIPEAVALYLQFKWQHDFQSHLFNKFNTADDKIFKSPASSFIVIFPSIAILCIFELFVIFAWAYLLKKNNEKVQMRKWPYIVLLVWSSMLFILCIIRFTKGADIYDALSLDDLKPNHSDIANYAREYASNHYKSYKLVASIIPLIVTVLLLVLNTSQLIGIKIQKNKIDNICNKSVLNNKK